MSETAWEPVIGLEIHVQLNTATKMFCACENRFGAEPNTLTCPLCLGHPGRAAGDQPGRGREGDRDRPGARTARIAERSEFHRKNYFYPDSPKAYQISQYDQPICVGGPSRRWTASRVGITRAHLEEDAAKLVHSGGEAGRIGGAEYSVVDFNRCGTPLVEIVTEPDLRSPEQAVALPGAAEEHPADDRRVRLRHGEGVAALRRQRVGAAGRERASWAPRPSSRT